VFVGFGLLVRLHAPDFLQDESFVTEFPERMPRHLMSTPEQNSTEDYPQSNPANERLTTAPRGRWTWLIVFGLAAACAAAYWYFFMQPAGDSAQRAGGDAAPRAGKSGTGGGPNAANRSTPVVAAPAKKGDVNVYMAGLGSVTPIATVTVRTRIDGQLMKVLFREGQMVRAGDVIAEIDPRTYQAQLGQAEGQMAKDVALLKNARLDAERYRVLFEQDSVAKQQLDTQESLVHQYEGGIKVDQAAIDTARLQLTYCRITAPISGRLGLRQVDPGNMVHASDANGLVVITQLQPIGVVFTVPEDALPVVMKKLRAGEKLPVDAYDRADKIKLGSGLLLTVDNQIDPATGTAKLKAQFDNEENNLFPNQFANVRMLVDVKRDATLVPGAAIQRGTPGTFVYLVRPDNTVTVRVVKLGPVQGDSVSIESGLAPGEQVVVDGADKLREGAKVELIVKGATPGRDDARKSGGPNPERKRGAGKTPGTVSVGVSGTQAAPAGTDTAKDAASGNGQAVSAEERGKRWAEVNARIDRGEFGEEIRKLPEQERMRRMRELRSQRDAGNSSSQTDR
jgi:multidrug efflux system membrane fusion protein